MSDVPIWEIERDEAGRAARMVMVGYEPEKVSTRRVGPQEGGFTPAERQLNLALGRRETKAQRILERLRMGPATTWDLGQVGGFRFSARLQELEARGLRYEREDRADHSVYTMTREPVGCVPEGE